MRKDLENKLFAEFADDGAAAVCFHYIIETYIYRREPVYTAEEVIALASKRTEAFDLSACPVNRKGRKNLVEEISDNLDSLNERQAERYIIRILENFWRYEIVMTEGEEHEIFINKLFLDKIGTDKEGSIKSLGGLWYYRLFCFARLLAGVCAEHGINLLDIQRKRDIKIIDSLNEAELSFFSVDGSFEYGKTLLENLNLPNGKHQIDERLQTEEAKVYFQRAIDKGLMSEDYKWLKEKQLCAWFCCRMSDKLHLGKGTKTDNKGKARERVNWKIFDFFGIKNLKGNFNDIQRIGTPPRGYKVIDVIFAD